MILDRVKDDTVQSRHSKGWYWTQAAAYTENQLVHYRGNSSPRFQQRAAAVDALFHLTTTPPHWLMDRGLTFQKCHCQGGQIIVAFTQQPINAFAESTFLSDVSFEWVFYIMGTWLPVSAEVAFEYKVTSVAQRRSTSIVFFRDFPFFWHILFFIKLQACWAQTENKSKLCLHWLKGSMFAVYSPPSNFAGEPAIFFFVG